ncbi:hypothetical protein FSP39_014394 [Pinctada imbricata]|uniref:NADAR domain-containing protein n=1 Tax=Pinctada imbricata TaxID=66713 RepID=A0AA89CA20_PINIB|nr:hypothetical protein FSP39_014394 [Pinctada imbricata]
MAMCTTKGNTSSDVNEQYEFFWSSDSPFSQWYFADMTIDGLTFNCAEQYMMYKKAVLMGDDNIASQILEERNPRAQKYLGRRVQNWNQLLWDKHCIDIVKKGNLEKFKQNKYLRRKLMSTFPKTLVEASPYDSIWGIGLHKSDKRAQHKQFWRGTNFLGYILTDIRNYLFAQETD